MLCSLLHFLVPFQVFLRDPDGYFIKFCAFNHMEDSMNALNLKVNASTADKPNDDGEEEDIRGIRKFWKKVRIGICICEVNRVDKTISLLR